MKVKEGIASMFWGTGYLRSDVSADFIDRKECTTLMFYESVRDNTYYNVGKNKYLCCVTLKLT